MFNLIKALLLSAARCTETEQTQREREVCARAGRESEQKQRERERERERERCVRIFLQSMVRVLGEQDLALRSVINALTLTALVNIKCTSV